MIYYPVFLNLKGRRVLVVGAGEIACQKLPALLAGGAKVHVVAPKALPEIRKLARDGRIKWSARSYESADAGGMAIVIAATDDKSLQKRIAANGRAQGAWVNIVDVPLLCDFIAPAIVRRGTIQVAVSTGGAAPALAKYLRQKVERLIGWEYAELAAVVEKLRPDILKLPGAKRKTFWERAVNDSFMNDLRKHGMARSKKLLKEWIHGR